MTMRAPSLASRAAVAAPNPEADPVITTHIPSLAIWFSFSASVVTDRDLAYRLAGTSWVKSVTWNNSEWRIMPLPQAALRTSALVTDGAFPHHGVNKGSAL